MPTEKRRLNITLTPAVEVALRKISQRDDVPEATKAMELLIHGLEIEEDEIWNSIASRRDTPKARFVSHEDAWV